MQLYTIQLSAGPVSSDMAGYHAWTALYAHYHGTADIYWNSRRVPGRRTVNSVIGRLTSGVGRAAMRERKNARRHASVLRAVGASRNWRRAFYLPSKNPVPPPRSRRTFASSPRGSTCPDSRTTRCTRRSSPHEPPPSAARPPSCLERDVTNTMKFSWICEIYNRRFINYSEYEKQPGDRDLRKKQ